MLRHVLARKSGLLVSSDFNGSEVIGEALRRKSVRALMIGVHALCVSTSSCTSLADTQPLCRWRVLPSQLNTAKGSSTDIQMPLFALECILQEPGESARALAALLDDEGEGVVRQNS